MRAGDVFLAMLSPGEPKRHFWVIVLSVDENSGSVLLVNISSHCFDTTTIIHNTEYEELTEDTSYVYYKGAHFRSKEDLQDKINKKQIYKKRPLPTKLLQEIQQGILLSKHTPLSIKSMFRQLTKK